MGFISCQVLKPELVQWQNCNCMKGKCIVQRENSNKFYTVTFRRVIIFTLGKNEFEQMAMKECLSLISFISP